MWNFSNLSSYNTCCELHRVYRKQHKRDITENSCGAKNRLRTSFTTIRLILYSILSPTSVNILNCIVIRTMYIATLAIVQCFEHDSSSNNIFYNIIFVILSMPCNYFSEDTSPLAHVILFRINLLKYVLSDSVEHVL